MTDAAAHLQAIRESWGDLLAAINQAPAAEWPPRHNREWEKPAREPDTATVGRLPLILREHPAPINLAAHDATCEIETALFDLADRIAAVTQSDVFGRDDPARWHYAGLRHLDRRAPIATAGSRALGLHWAACWIEDRLAQTEPTDLHGVVRGVMRDHAEQVTAREHDVLRRALGRDGRTTPLADPCPWCHGQLTARTTSGDPYAATITCSTGPTCTAPVPYDDQARRAWHGHLLGQLYGALSAARAAA